MKIANPIYDVVFKYLMEDLDIAKAMLSAILSIDIVSLEMKPLEMATKYKGNISLVRIDFKATIRTKDGSFKVILIELQKSKKGLELVRFRRYLALHYSKLEQITNEKGKTEKLNLPITTIYFLGYRLKNIKTPVLKVIRGYYNAMTNRRINAKENFIEVLSHDLYAIQIPRLSMVAQTEMEKMLDVFSQVKYKTNDKKVLEYTGSTDNPIVERMVNRLNSALLDEDLIRNMQLEEEVDMEFALVNEQLEEALKVKNDALKAKEEALKTTSEAIKATDEAIKATDDERQQKERYKSEVELLKKRLADMEKQLATKKD